MEILDRLERLKEELRDERKELSYESHTCLQAKGIIEGLTRRVAQLEKQETARFDRFFAAALTGLLSRPVRFRRSYEESVEKARDYARLACKVSPEGS